MSKKAPPMHSDTFCNHDVISQSRRTARRNTHNFKMKTQKTTSSILYNRGNAYVSERDESVVLLLMCVDGDGGNARFNDFFEFRKNEERFFCGVPKQGKTRRCESMVNR
jgi:hypothetical protein